jgi:hypothetical protein
VGRLEKVGRVYGQPDAKQVQQAPAEAVARLAKGADLGLLLRGRERRGQRLVGLLAWAGEGAKVEGSGGWWLVLR